MIKQENALDLLGQAAALYDARNAQYGNSYVSFGPALMAIFEGNFPKVTLAADAARLGVFIQCVSKLMRWAANFEKGGHEDSARDLIVYAAMLQELTDEQR